MASLGPAVTVNPALLKDVVPLTIEKISGVSAREALTERSVVLLTGQPAEEGIATLCRGLAHHTVVIGWTRGESEGLSFLEERGFKIWNAECGTLFTKGVETLGWGKVGELLSIKVLFESPVPRL